MVDTVALHTAAHALSPDQRAVLEVLLSGSAKRKDVEKKTGFSEDKVRSILNALTEIGHINRAGQGKATYYILKSPGIIQNKIEEQMSMCITPTSANSHQLYLLSITQLDPDNVRSFVVPIQLNSGDVIRTAHTDYEFMVEDLDVLHNFIAHVVKGNPEQREIWFAFGNFINNLEPQADQFDVNCRIFSTAAEPDIDVERLPAHHRDDVVRTGLQFKLRCRHKILLRSWDGRKLNVPQYEFSYTVPLIDKS